MRVKHGDRWYDCEPGKPLMVELTEADKHNIANMHPDSTAYACFDDTDRTTPDEKRAWMATPPAERVKEILTARYIDTARASEIMEALQPVLLERIRQVTKKGMTPQADDAYQDSQLALGAMAYLAASKMLNDIGHDAEAPAPDAAGELWPEDWPTDSFKPWDSDSSSRISDQLRCLDKAGAMLLAERQRVMREQMAEEACAAQERRDEGR